MNEGAIFFEGDPENAVKDEKIKKFYLKKVKKNGRIELMNKS